MLWVFKTRQGQLGILKMGNQQVGFPSGPSGKEPVCRSRRHETGPQSPGGEDPLEEGMATHSSILAWRIPWAEEPGGLQSIDSQKDTTEVT